MAILLPGAMNQLANVSVTAQFERLRSSHLTRAWSSGSTNGLTRLDGQGGVWPQPNALNVTASGTPDMNVHADRGSGLTQGTENVTQGNYPFFNLASLTVAIAASNTQQRIDSVVVHNKDTFYSGATDTCEIVSIAGTPGSGSPPNLSSLDKNYLEIARVTVRANTTSILNSDITNMQHILPVGLDVPLSSELSNAGTFHGHPRVNTTSGEFEWYDMNSSTWHGQQWVSYTPTWSGFGSLGSGFTSIGAYFKTGTRVCLNVLLIAGTSPSMGTNNLNFSIPFTSANINANAAWCGTGLFRVNGLAGNIQEIACAVSPNASVCGFAAVIPGSGGSANTWSSPGTQGYSFVANSTIQCAVEYQSAS
jgi:hypothetical protein